MEEIVPENPKEPVFFLKCPVHNESPRMIVDEKEIIKVICCCDDFKKKCMHEINQMLSFSGRN